MKAKGNLSLLFGVLGIFVFMGVVAIVFGIGAINYSKEHPECSEARMTRLKGIAGLILGIIGTILSAISLVLLIKFVFLFP